MYPFKIRINNPELMKIMERVEHNRIVELPSRSLSTMITWKLKPIRPDLVLGYDNRYQKTYFALKPFVTLQTKKNNKSMDLIFKKLF